MTIGFAEQILHYANWMAGLRRYKFNYMNNIIISLRSYNNITEIIGLIITSEWFHIMSSYLNDYGLEKRWELNPRVSWCLTCLRPPYLLCTMYLDCYY